MVPLIRSAMCDLLPAAGGLPGVHDTGITAFLTQLRRETTSLTWVGLCLGAVLYALTPVLTIGVPLPSFMLSPERRDRHANGITNTQIYLLRQAVVLLKMYACMCWGQDANVRRHFQIAPYPADPGTFRASS
ncbi:MAG: hypothetical protein EXR69_05510 [Myxococcales bacterium]|nr:hypothetical protein [Myxococcales bacterium]